MKLYILQDSVTGEKFAQIYDKPCNVIFNTNTVVLFVVNVAFKTVPSYFEQIDIMRSMPILVG